MRRLFALLLTLLPLAAQAGEPYARQWPLELARADAGAYRVTLDASVYRAAYWPDLRDVRVLDAQGREVASIVVPAQPPSTRVQTTILRWFPLPTGATTTGADLSVLVRRDSGGAVVSVRGGAAPRAGAVVGTGWLVDLGADSARMRSLALDWNNDAESVDLGYRLEGSDDLRDWRILDPQVRLVRLRNQGQELRSNRIALDSPPRYLRLLPLQEGGALTVSEIRGEWREAAEPVGWQWLELSATPAPATAGTGFHYRLEGRYPVQRVDVAMPANSSVRWSVFSRDGDARKGDASPPAWKLRAAGWNAWRLDDAGRTQTSPPLDLHYLITDHDWRLQPDAGTTPTMAPTLRLGYVPGSLVFLDQGKPPYVLVAGSASEDIAQDAVESMLEALRVRRGAQWVPAAATLGAASERAGAAAYLPASAPRDWKTLTLWSLLVLGALVVVGFAFTLLRHRDGSPRD